MNHGAAIAIAELTKRFGTFTAVDRLTLTVQRGEIFGLLGPNGSGKTTTVNMISGLSRPTSGSMTVMGYDIARDVRAVRALLGAVPQETALYEELSARRNMAFHAELYGVPASERDKRITELLELVGLSDRKQSRVGTFSGGMKRRLALARALLHDPQLIYLDEPTLGVDVQSRRALWDYILGLKARAKTVLLTTNYLEEANALCDRLAILDRGKLVALDTPANLKRTYGDTILEVETAQPLSQALLERLRAIPGVRDVSVHDAAVKVSAGGDQPVVGQVLTLITQETVLRSVAQREPNLDEIFLSLTGTGLRD
jgi:daunorubicin resistance ABC transporter ATP-binding subunit